MGALALGQRRTGQLVQSAKKLVSPDKSIVAAAISSLGSIGKKAQSYWQSS